MADDVKNPDQLDLGINPEEEKLSDAEVTRRAEDVAHQRGYASGLEAGLNAARKNAGKSGSGTGPMEVRIVSIDATARNTLDNLKVQVDRINDASRTGAPASQKQSENVDKLAGKNNRRRSPVSEQSKSKERRIVGIENPLIQKGGEKFKATMDLDPVSLKKNLDNFMDMSKSRLDTGRKLNYTYQDNSGKEQISKTPISFKDIKDFQKKYKDIELSTINTEDLTKKELASYRAMVDLSSKRASNEKNNENLLRRQTSVIKDHNREQELNAKSQKVTQDIFRQKPAAVVEDLRHQGVITGQRGIGKLDYLTKIEGSKGQTVSEMRSISESDLANLVKKVQTKDFESPEEEQVLTKRLSEIKTTTQGQVAASGGTYDSSSFRPSELFHKLTAGDFKGAFQEITQPVAFAQGVRSRRLASAASYSAQAAALPEGEAGLGLRAAAGMQTGLAGLTTLLNPVALIAALHYAPKAIQAAWDNTAGQIIQPLHNAQQIGQITGQGVEAGFSANRQAFTSAIDPFDLLDYGTALAIQKGVRGQGFRDATANAISGTLGTLVNKGIGDWQTNLDILTVALRQGGMTLGQFSDTMETLKTTAGDTNTSVSDMTKAFQTLQITETQAGGTSAGAATKLTSAEEAFATKGGLQGKGNQFGGVFSGAAGSQMLSGWLGNQTVVAQIAGAEGVPIAYAQSMSPDKFAQGMDKILSRWANQRPAHLSLQQWAEWIYSMGGQGIFTGLTAPAIVALLKPYVKGDSNVMEQSVNAQIRSEAITSNKPGGGISASIGHIVGSVSGSVGKTVSGSLGWLAPAIGIAAGPVGVLTGSAIVAGKTFENLESSGKSPIKAQDEETSTVVNKLRQSHTSPRIVENIALQLKGIQAKNDMFESSEFKKALSTISSDTQRGQTAQLNRDYGTPQDTRKILVELGPQANKLFKVMNKDAEDYYKGLGPGTNTVRNP